MDTHPLTDHRLDGIPVEESGEPLVDVDGVAALAVDPRLRGRDGSSTRLRSTVVDQLVTAQSLLPRGLRLLLIEGHRSAGRQREHFDECVTALTVAHPDWSPLRVLEEAGWHCSPSGTAPHLTGAAADLTLCDPRGVELDLGGPVHADPTGAACRTGVAGIAAQARAHRQALGTALSGAGLINLPAAWWHWSFGDRYWALVTGTRAAIYGPVEPVRGRQN
jgi:D-alanyl-D-alanine dipeptidase